MLVDIGINLTNNRFDKDRADVIARAKQAQVHQLIVTGTCQKTSKQALTLCQQYPETLTCTAGVHPHDAKSWNESSRNNICKLAEHSAVVAIGECGLDFNRDISPRPQQEACFESQLGLAAELGKPVFLHERDVHWA